MQLAPDIQAKEAKQLFDAKIVLPFPGCVDAHMHIGIYAPLAQDAVSESKAAAMGGVTSSLNYIRTGHYYLNRGGPYRAFMAEVFKQAKDKFWVDYGFHIAPIEIRDTSTRWNISLRITALRRSRSSCSTAATGCTALRRSRTNS